MLICFANYLHRTSSIVYGVINVACVRNVYFGRHILGLERLSAGIEKLKGGLTKSLFGSTEDPIRRGAKKAVLNEDGDAGSLARATQPMRDPVHVYHVAVRRCDRVRLHWISKLRYQSWLYKREQAP